MNAIRQPVKKSTKILIATGFAVVATTCSGIFYALVGDSRGPLVELGVLMHCPALIAYIGTLAEHDPFKGWGVVPFIFIQWCVAGYGLGCFVTEIRPRRHEKHVL